MLLEQGHSTTSPPFHLFPIVGLFACCSRSSRIILFVFVGAMRSLSISFHPFKRLEIRARQRGLFTGEEETIIVTFPIRLLLPIIAYDSPFVVYLVTILSTLFHLFRPFLSHFAGVVHLGVVLKNFTT